MAETATEETVETTVTAAPQQQAATATVESLQAENERLQKALKERNKEEAARRKKLEELEAAEKARQEADLSALEKANKENAELKSALQTSRRAELQRAVADEVGLPAAFASRINGEDKDTMTADAKTLLEAMPKKQPPAIAPTNPANATQTGETDAERRRRLGLI